MIKSLGVVTVADAVETLVLTEDKAFVRTNIEQIDMPVEEGSQQEPQKGYKYDEYEYSKDEYIALMSKNQVDMSSTIDDLLILIPELVTVGGASNV